MLCIDKRMYNEHLYNTSLQAHILCTCSVFTRRVIDLPIQTAAPHHHYHPLGSCQLTGGGEGGVGSRTLAPARKLITETDTRILYTRHRDVVEEE